MRDRFVPGMALAVLLAACGADGGGGGGALRCDALPTCYTEALAALRACATESSLALGTPVNSSGVVENLTCTGGTMAVAFTPFSFSATGTVPIPGTTTIRQSGTDCANVELATGSTGGPNQPTRTFDRATVDVPGSEPVHVDRYSDGSIGIACGFDDPLEAPAGSLTGCADDVVSAVTVRNTDITMMGVDLVDATGASTPLFSCTR